MIKKTGQYICRSDLVTSLSTKVCITPEVTDQVVKVILNVMYSQLKVGGRIEIRKFGSFKINKYLPKKVRNPKTGERIMLPAIYRATFKSGSSLCSRINK